MKDLIDMLVECGAVRFGDFTLTSGKKSPYYVDIKMASTRPDVLKRMAGEMAPLVKGQFLAGMELGAVPLMVAVALETGKPYVIIRKGDRSHGTAKQIEGSLPGGAEVTLIEDVVTTGGSSVKSVGVLQGAGASVIQLIAVVDREEGGVDSIGPMDIEFIPLVRASQLLKRKG